VAGVGAVSPAVGIAGLPRSPLRGLSGSPALSPPPIPRYPHSIWITAVVNQMQPQATTAIPIPIKTITSINTRTSSSGSDSSGNKLTCQLGETFLKRKFCQPLPHGTLQLLAMITTTTIAAIAVMSLRNNRALHPLPWLTKITFPSSQYRVAGTRVAHPLPRPSDLLSAVLLAPTFLLRLSSAAPQLLPRIWTA